MRGRAGFSLVELAIVLVIIGLITLAIITGRGFSETSRAQNLIKEYKSYEAATNMFKQTFGELPGDFSRAMNQLGTSRNGDGNGVVLAENGYYEHADFFPHLSIAKFIDDELSIYTTGTYTLGTHAQPNHSISDAFWMVKNLHTFEGTPPGDNAAMSWYPNVGINQDADRTTDNYFVTGTFQGGYEVSYGISVSVARTVDLKADDGLPNTGIIRGGQGIGPWGNWADCVSSFAEGTGYNNESDYGCALAFRLK